jgi:hypothetical protein
MHVRWVPIAALIFCQIASAAEAPAAAPSAQPPEVSIQSQRERLHALRAELYDLEDRFFEEYNKINDVWYYKVRCRWEYVNMYKIHVCSPLFQESAERDAARSFFTPGSTGTAIASDNSVRLRTPAYQKHMAELVAKNPQLLAVLKQRAEVNRDYRTLWRQMHKDKMWVWD